jgi:hypothetical protein
MEKVEYGDRGCQDGEIESNLEPIIDFGGSKVTL